MNLKKRKGEKERVGCGCVGGCLGWVCNYTATAVDLLLKCLNNKPKQTFTNKKLNNYST